MALEPWVALEPEMSWSLRGPGVVGSRPISLLPTRMQWPLSLKCLGALEAQEFWGVGQVAYSPLGCGPGAITGP